MPFIFALVLFLLFPSFGKADLPIAPESHWKSLGYQAISSSRMNKLSQNQITNPDKKQRPYVSEKSKIGSLPTPTPHSIPWPVEFASETKTIANSMAQYQPFGDPYFHGGCDLRVKPNEKLYASVSGKLEAGHYGYSKNPDGSLKKHWRPWPQNGDALYFELAVVDELGIRHEYHHVDRSSLPQDVIQILDSQEKIVAAGTYLGNTIYWPGSDYHHIHLNLILPDETRLNPEYYFPLIADSQPPQVWNLFFRSAAGWEYFADNNLLVRPEEIAIQTSDRKNGSPYENPPVLAKIEFENGVQFQWDFRERLWHEGSFPKLNQFFQYQLRTLEGKNFRTEGGYGTGKSLIRLPIPPQAAGSFRILLEDNAGNRWEHFGSMPSYEWQRFTKNLP